MPHVTEVAKIRGKVLAELARMAFADTLEDKVEEILYTVVTEDGPRYRCCVHKERAVLKDRINLALSQPMKSELTTAVKQALSGLSQDMPIINVLPEACDRCPIDKFLVTDACRNCVAHNCISSCPRQAIMVVQNRAYIDKSRCVECGTCKKSCAYGAIIEISRPCERSCALKAITAGNDRRASIDYGKCTQCGSCMVACPFGAISDRSEIVQIISKLKNSQKLYALLAPAFIGQFGAKVAPSQVFAALKQIGFDAVQEVSYGADIVTVEETKEFIESVPKLKSFMTTSCCPAFVKMVEQHLSQALPMISSTVSPMVAGAQLIKAKDPEAIVVFIGPCVAKKAEGVMRSTDVDYVITFEELAAIFAGADIDVARYALTKYDTAASQTGNNFARAGGVIEAVQAAAAAISPNTVIKPHRCEGLAACKEALTQILAGKLDVNFFEGMACTGGCVGGPGTLADYRVTGKLVEKFAGTAENKAAPANQKAMRDAVNPGLHWHKSESSLC